MVKEKPIIIVGAISILSLMIMTLAATSPNFITANVLSTTSPATLTVGVGYQTYFFVFADQSTGTTAAPTYNIIMAISKDVGTGASTKKGDNATAIGYNSVNTLSNSGTMTHAGTPSFAIAGIGTNVIAAYNAVLVTNSASGASGILIAANIVITTPTANTIVYEFFADGGAVFSTLTLASGCTAVNTVIQGTVAETEIANCIFASAGAHTTVFTGKGVLSSAAYGFVQYNAIYNDEPTSDNTDVIGARQANGNMIFNIGTFPINAVDFGSLTFNSWRVSNSVNAIIGSLTSSNTFVTVFGNDVITANWLSPSGCTISSNVASIGFLALNPGQTNSAFNVLKITNSGTAATNILASGGSWTSLSNNIDVSNTAYSAASGTTFFSATKLSASSTDTFIAVPASANNNIFWANNSPVGQPAGSWTQSITLSSSC